MKLWLASEVAIFAPFPDDITLCWGRIQGLYAALVSGHLPGEALKSGQTQGSLRNGLKS